MQIICLQEIVAHKGSCLVRKFDVTQKMCQITILSRKFEVNNLSKLSDQDTVCVLLEHTVCILFTHFKKTICLFSRRFLSFYSRAVFNQERVMMAHIR